MWIVFALAGDAEAEWVRASLAARRRDPVELITADELVAAQHWEHRLRDSWFHIRFRLADGRALNSDGITAVLNRLYTLPAGYLRNAHPADVEYAAQEYLAFFLSWIHALPCPVVNRPSPRGLGGDDPHASEWVLRAHAAGLRTSSYRYGDAVPNGGGAPERRTVFVAGERVIGEAPEELNAACRRLADAAGVSLLGVDFSSDWTFVSASVLPNLRKGGDALLDAILALLSS